MGTTACTTTFCSQFPVHEFSLTEEATTYPPHIEFSVTSEAIDSISIPVARTSSSNLRKSRVLLDEPSPIHTKIQLSPDSSILTEFSRPIYPSDLVIYEAELIRIMPGSHIKCIHRWCILTISELQMFKNKYAVISKEKPLISIPVSKITSIEFFAQGKDCSLHKLQITLQQDPSSILLNQSLNSIATETRPRQKQSKATWSARLRDQQESPNVFTFGVMHTFEFEKWQSAFKQLLCLE